jgi:hypothetical protein
MSNYTKLVNDKAIASWIADSLQLSRGSLGMRATVESLDLNDALTLAKILDIKQPSGNPLLNIQNLDQEFLLEADGSPLMDTIPFPPKSGLIWNNTKRKWVEDSNMMNGELK